MNTATGVSDTLTVIQVQDNALVVSQKEYEVSPSGTIIDVKYQTNVEVEYEIPTEYSSWIKAVPSSPKGYSAKKIRRERYSDTVMKQTSP